MPKAHDKHQHEVDKGDLVEVVHFGEHHTFAVEEIHEEHSHFYLTGSITIVVPALACTWKTAENSKDTPKEATKAK
jgi:hypothetical protein